MYGCEDRDISFLNNYVSLVIVIDLCQLDQTVTEKGAFQQAGWTILQFSMTKTQRPHIANSQQIGESYTVQSWFAFHHQIMAWFVLFWRAWKLHPKTHSKERKKMCPNCKTCIGRPTYLYGKYLQSLHSRDHPRQLSCGKARCKVDTAQTNRHWECMPGQHCHIPAHNLLSQMALNAWLMWSQIKIGNHFDGIAS